MTCVLTIREDIQSSPVFSAGCDLSQVQKAHKEITDAAKAIGLVSSDQLPLLGYEQLKQVDWATVRQAVDHVQCLLPDCKQYISESISGNPFDVTPTTKPFDNPVHIPNFVYVVIVCLAIYFTAQAYDFDLTKLRSLLKRNGKRA